MLTGGPVRSMVHDASAGVGSETPSTVAMTRKSCGPSPSSRSTTGELHGEKSAWSRLQAKVAPARSAVKESVAVNARVGLVGAPLSSVCGVTNPTLHDQVAGVA